MPTRTVTDKALASPLVAGVIDELAGNVTGIHTEPSNTRRDKRRRACIDAVLMQLAREVAGLSLPASPPPPDFATAVWKSYWAYRAIQVLFDEGIDDLVQRTQADIARRFPNRAVHANSNFTEYALFKVAVYVAQVARLICLGLPPEVLVMTKEEYRRTLLESVRLGSQGGNIMVVRV